MSSSATNGLDRQLLHWRTGEALFGGRTLRLVLADNAKWLRGESVFHGSDLTDSNLSRFRLGDIRASNLSLPWRDPIPVIPRIHQRIYEAAGRPNALDMRLVHHPCGTKHCRAGWAVHLAGEAGYALEKQIGWNAAAALIYMASDPKLDRIPDFYADDDEALEDMRRLAEQEENREQEASHE